MNREPNKADVNCSTVLKMCTAELDRMKHWCAKNNNNCNDRFFMIAIKITPETSLLYAGSETARALRECGAGIESHSVILNSYSFLPTNTSLKQSDSNSHRAGASAELTDGPE